MEELAKQMDTIMASEDFTVPRMGMDELQIMLATFGVKLQAE